MSDTVQMRLPLHPWLKMAAPAFCFTFTSKRLVFALAKVEVLSCRENELLEALRAEILPKRDPFWLSLDGKNIMRSRRLPSLVSSGRIFMPVLLPQVLLLQFPSLTRSTLVLVAFW